ncbi:MULTISPECIES: transposase [unclassified Azospirillum]|uniref:transposase n=1 Tax=unclassified Azospirillum TaxID=2630922 RepID=UPI00130490AA|nr:MULTISPECIES: transposase [unclassified Azospirillum]
MSEFVNALKTGTSRRLRAEFPDEVNRWDSKPALRSRSCCVMSVGGASLEVLKRDIEGRAGADE